MNKKGASAPFLGHGLTVARLLLVVVCSFIFLPFAFLAVVIGGSAMAEGGVGLLLGAFVFAWGLGAPIGLAGYLATTMGWEHRVNGACRLRFATLIALVWGGVSAGLLVVPEVVWGQESFSVHFLPLTILLLDAIGLFLMRMFR